MAIVHGTPDVSGTSFELILPATGHGKAKPALVNLQGQYSPVPMGVITEVVDANTLKVATAGTVTDTDANWKTITIDGSSLVPDTRYYVAKADTSKVTSVRGDGYCLAFYAITATQVAVSLIPNESVIQSEDSGELWSATVNADNEFTVIGVKD